MNFIQELKKIPFVRLLIPLMTGLIIGIRSDISCTVPVIICLFLLFPIFILGFNLLQEKYKNRWIFGVSLYVFIIMAGILLIKLKLMDSKRLSPQIDNSECLIAKVIAHPQNRVNTVKVILKIIGYRDSTTWYKSKAKILASFQKDNTTGNILNGDIMLLRTKLREAMEPMNPGEFNYKKYLQYKGIIYRSYIYSGTWKKVGHEKTLMVLASDMRNTLLQLYKKFGFDNDKFAVLSAITLGYKDALTPDIKKTFSSAGAIHILAVSGLHTGIIFYILNFLLSFLGKSFYGKTIKLVIVILVLWFYALLTGLSIPVIRASAMFSLIQFGNSFRRNINIYNILAVLAFFVLIINPLQICDIGFQLSFLAVLSIVIFQPRFYNLLTFKNRIIDKIWVLFTVSVAAQLGIFPLVIHYFHHFSMYFWITNLIIIFPAAIVIYLAILLFIFSPVNQIAYVIAQFLNLILTLINLFVKAVKRLPFSLLEGIYNTYTETILLYLIIISISIFIIFKHRIYLKISLFCILCFLSINLFREYKINNQERIIVFNIYNHTALNFIEGRNNYLFTDLSDNNMLISSVKNCWIKYGISKKNKIISLVDSSVNLNSCNSIGEIIFRNLHDNVIFNFKGQKLLLLVNNKLFKYTINKRYQLDYLIIANNVRVSFSQLLRVFDIEYIIVDSSNSYWTKKYWKEECMTYDIYPHILSEKGAFELEL